MDKVLDCLKEAIAELLAEKERIGGSRRLSITLTEIESAMLWRQEDLRLKQPPSDQVVL